MSGNVCRSYTSYSIISAPGHEPYFITVFILIQSIIVAIAPIFENVVAIAVKVLPDLRNEMQKRLPHVVGFIAVDRNTAGINLIHELFPTPENCLLAIV